MVDEPLDIRTRHQLRTVGTALRHGKAAMPAVLVLVRRVASEQRTVLPGLRYVVVPAAAILSGSLCWRDLSDQSCAALESDVLPQPAECDDKAVACLDEEINVHQAPE